MGRYFVSTSSATAVQRCTLEVMGACCYLWTVPSNVTTATFEVWGGGGAGAQKCCCYCGGGGSGAGGGYALKTISVTPGAQYTICAGGGGPSTYCAVSGVMTGCSGSTSYVTGTGLSNLCANGGGGGYWCCRIGTCVCCGGLAYGGDVNLSGGFTWQSIGQSWPCNMSFGGPAPFGGGWSSFHSQNCQQACQPGCIGNFPGGGGTGQSNNCCDCCVCNGPGAAGLVRVTF